MITLRQKLHKHFKAITGFLVVVELILMVLPAHYHVHHEYAAGAIEHSHAVDLHVMANTTDHQHTDNTQLFNSSPDGLLKYLDSSLLPILFIALFLNLLSIAICHFVVRSRSEILLSPQHLFYRSPPSRGPPLLA